MFESPELILLWLLSSFIVGVRAWAFPNADKLVCETPSDFLAVGDG